MLHRNRIRFAVISLSVTSLYTVSLGRAEEAKSVPHPGPWPIQHGHNLQPREDQLRAMQRQDLTPQESGEVDRLYKQLEQSSQKMLEHRHVSR
jgi:hypothetical protein